MFIKKFMDMDKKFRIKYVHPSGKDFENFLSDYCWVHGTIPLRSNEPMPKTPEEWEIYEKQRRICKLSLSRYM
ncbi:Innexin unc-9 [Schistosoma japonicum]|nr:Innexin unc-9 [Schistosoma japonicum]